MKGQNSDTPIASLVSNMLEVVHIELIKRKQH